MSSLICVGLLIPSVIHGQETGIPVANHAEQVNKAVKITGYGAIATIGGGLVVLGMGSAVGRYMGPQKSNWIKKLRFRKKDTEKEEDIRLFVIKVATMTTLGVGMIGYGVRGLQKTLYGQTEQSEKEQNEKIKETITEAGKAVFDISKRAVWVTIYSISAGIGTVTLLAATGQWVKGMIVNNRNLLEQFKTQWEKGIYKFAKSCSLFPLGAGLVMFGIHGLSKEYQTWKKSEIRQNIGGTQEAIIKEKVDVAVQTDISHLEEKENI